MEKIAQDPRIGYRRSIPIGDFFERQRRMTHSLFLHDDYFMKEMKKWPIYFDRIVSQNHTKLTNGIYTLRARAKKSGLYPAPTRQQPLIQRGFSRRAIPYFKRAWTSV